MNAPEVVGTIIIVGLLVLVGVAVKLYDRKRKREDEAIQLQAQVSDALLRDPRLAFVPIVATAHVPAFGDGPAIVELSGQVPSSELRQTALRVAEMEASRIKPNVVTVDRLSAMETAATRAA